MSANTLDQLLAVRNLLLTTFRRSLIVCVVACALVGCHGGPDTDIIERELRWHEDQIYALEDYLMEYQAKVRRLREENAALSQALAEKKQEPSWHNDSLLPEPTPTTRRHSGASSSKKLKSRTPAPKSNAEEINLPGIPALDAPGVPPPVPQLESPLDEGEPSAASGSPGIDWISKTVTKTTAYKPPLAAEPNAPWAVVIVSEPVTEPLPIASPALGWIQPVETVPVETAPVKPAPVVQTSVVQESDSEKFAQAAGWIGETPWISSTAEPLPLAEESEPKQQPEIVLVDATPVLSYRPRTVLMEVELGGSNKSVVVRVTPLAADYQRAAFEGSASLMVRDPDAEQSELARWEYTAEEVADAWVNTPRGRVLEFELPLVEAIPTEVPVELWVRMVPASEDETTEDESAGPEKILDHMVLRLESLHGPTRIEMGSDWAVATPGAPQLLERPKTTISSQWRSTGSKSVR